MTDPIPQPVQNREIMSMGETSERMPIGQANMRIDLVNRSLVISSMNAACSSLFQPPSASEVVYQPLDNSLLERMKALSGGIFREEDAATMIENHIALVRQAMEPGAEVRPRDIIYEVGERVIRERLLVVNPSAEDAVEVLVQLEDYSQELQTLREAVVGKADSLTGLFDRNYLVSQIEEALKSGRQFALLFADVDFFKDVNEEHGHIAGDDTLVQLADKVRSCIRTTGASDLTLRELYVLAQKMDLLKSETAPLLVDATTKEQEKRKGTNDRNTDVLLFPGEPGRVGGDEFLVLLPDLPPEAVDTVRERVEREVETIKIGQNSNAHLEVSIDGIHSSEILALAEGSPMTAEQMVDAADNAMYMRKLKRHLQTYEGRVRAFLSKAGFTESGDESIDTIDNILSGIRLTAETSFKLMDAFPGMDRKRLQTILNVTLTSMLNDTLFVVVYDKFFNNKDFGIHDLPAMRDDILDIGMFIRGMGPIIGGNAVLNAQVTEELRVYRAGKGERKWEELSQEAKLAHILFRQYIHHSIQPMSYPAEAFGIDLDKTTDPNDDVVIKFKELISIRET